MSSIYFARTKEKEYSETPLYKPDPPHPNGFFAQFFPKQLIKQQLNN